MIHRGRTRRLCSVFAILLTAAAFAGAARAGDDCKLERVIKVDMTPMTSGKMSVPMVVNGQTVNMLVDTGGAFSMLTPETVASLNLEPRMLPQNGFSQYGGFRIDHWAIADNVSLGPVTGKRFGFLIMPANGYSSDMGGVLAPDVLSEYDTELDFANSSFSLFMPNTCEDRVVYWTHDPFGEVDFGLGRVRHIIVTVLLDGKEIRAIVDTGAFRSSASLEEIEDDFNLNENSPGMQPISGVRVASTASKHSQYRYPFKALSFQSVSVVNPDIVLIPDDQSRMPPGEPRMLLGINVLRQLHLYISYRQKKLYVTPASAH